MGYRWYRLEITNGIPTTHIIALCPGYDLVHFCPKTHFWTQRKCGYTGIPTFSFTKQRCEARCPRMRPRLGLMRCNLQLQSLLQSFSPFLLLVKFLDLWNTVFPKHTELIGLRFVGGLRLLLTFRCHCWSNLLEATFTAIRSLLGASLNPSFALLCKLLHTVYRDTEIELSNQSARQDSKSPTCSDSVPQLNVCVSYLWGFPFFNYLGVCWT